MTADVPEITPVFVFKLTPLGSAGETEYEVGALTHEEGVSAVIAAFWTYVDELGVYTQPVTAGGLTLMETVNAVPTPPSFEGVTVYTTAAAVAVESVPDKTPVDVEKPRPAIVLAEEKVNDCPVAQEDGVRVKALPVVIT